MMWKINKLLKEYCVLIIIERIGKTVGEVHGDCNHPKLMEPNFLQEMNDYVYILKRKKLGEEISNLMFYTFESIAS